MFRQPVSGFADQINVAHAVQGIPDTHHVRRKGLYPAFVTKRARKMEFNETMYDAESRTRARGKAKSFCRLFCQDLARTVADLDFEASRRAAVGNLAMGDNCWNKRYS